MKNYRPISVLPFFLFQNYWKGWSLIGRYFFLSNNRIFTEAQNGFMKGICIETAFHSFIERIQEALDNGLHMIGIILI